MRLRLFRRTTPEPQPETPTALLELPYPAKHRSRDNDAAQLSPRQERRADRHARKAEANTAPLTVNHRERQAALAAAVARQLDEGDTKPITLGTLALARIPDYLPDPYSGATA